MVKNFFAQATRGLTLINPLATPLGAPVRVSGVALGESHGGTVQGHGPC